MNIINEYDDENTHKRDALNDTQEVKLFPMK